MTRSAAPKRAEQADDAFDLSRARLVRRGPRGGRPSRMTLRALRLAAGKTQLEVSETTGIAQGDVSKVERRAELDELVVSTLRRYVEAIGGKLEVVAVFPAGHRIALAGYEGPDAEHGRAKA